MSQSVDYQKGYAAGKRYADRTEKAEQRSHARHMARMALAAAVVPEILQNPWRRKKGDEWVTLNTAAGVAGTVVDIVKAIEVKL